MQARVLGLLCAVLFMASAYADLPAITGKPEIDAPALLEWSADQGAVQPNLNDPIADTLFDFHGTLNTCDMVFSTEGNYHPALHDVWPLYLAKFKNAPLHNAFYSTSPPVFAPQAKNQMLEFGNLYVTCAPQLAAGSMKAIKKLQDAGMAEGAPIPFYRDRGEVILVKKGNPKHIETVWDLARPDVHYASPNPTLEPGAFGNYVNTIYGIAKNDKHPPQGMTPEKLIDAIFNNSRVPHKWLAGPRIHHRDVPWSIAHGRGDAGVILYHLALYTKQTFPDQFDIVPLGGTVSHPQPLPGSAAGSVRYVVRVKGAWNPRQQKATETLIQTLLSPEFTQILQRHGLARPAGYKEDGQARQ